MSEDFPYADIVILALFAGFILLRLRSILGTRKGPGDPDYFQRVVPPEKTVQEPIIQIDEKTAKLKPKDETDPYLATLADGAVADVIGRIKAKDASFSATRFLAGARAAFEMVFDAYVKGDRQTLKLLLSDAIFQHFSQELDKRTGQEGVPETTLVSVAARDIAQAILDNTTARLTVHFVSEQVTVVRNAKGDIIGGNPSDLHQVEDRWTFERDVMSKNPNWKIVET
ncbi:MAG: Tim44 domain-containing protein [Pseudomonadota bacterium]|nr:Tim44 domain-containing protein [Pseudomonadota bacterium]MDE3037339.1 Tim44 domain-containing protein [Pseudomonadota bacterium]